MPAELAKAALLLPPLPLPLPRGPEDEEGYRPPPPAAAASEANDRPGGSPPPLEPNRSAYDVPAGRAPELDGPPLGRGCLLFEPPPTMDMPSLLERLVDILARGLAWG